MLVGCGSKENGRIGDSPHRAGTNIISEGLLYSSPITSITTRGKNSSLGMRHYKLKASPRPSGESLES